MEWVARYNEYKFEVALNKVAVVHVQDTHDDDINNEDRAEATSGVGAIWGKAKFTLWLPQIQRFFHISIGSQLGMAHS